MKVKTFQFFFLLIFFIFVPMAMAAGEHTGGHGHGEGHDPYAEIGKPGVSTEVDRTVAVEMNDAMRFVPDTLAVKQGETIRFVVKNVGKTDHEFVLGTEKDLQAHYEMMKKYPEMEHEDPSMIRVDPGQTGEVIWQFTKAGQVHFGCLLPGHYEAGMKGAVSVETAAAPGHNAEGKGKTGHQH